MSTLTFQYSYDEEDRHIEIRASNHVPASAFEDGDEFDNLPDSVSILYGVTFIGDSAFEDLFLKKVSLPFTLESIGKRAFNDNFIESLDLPYSLVSIGAEAFEYNDISDLYIPDSVTSLGIEAFKGNDDLYEVSLPHHFKEKPPYAAFDRGMVFNFREPAPYQSIIRSVNGKGKLKGTNVANAFLFDSFDSFGKKSADKIIGFNSSQGDIISVGRNAFPALKGASDASDFSFASAKSKKKLKKLSKADYDFVYFENKGRLYFDGNGSEKGWGNSSEGGLAAILKGSPELTIEDITLYSW